MFIAANICYDSDNELFRKRLELLYRLGYQGGIVDLGQIEKLSEFKTIYYPNQKSPKISPPVSIPSLLSYKIEGLPIPIIPRITLRPHSPEQLKNLLSQMIIHKVLIAVESLSKEVLEVAARDGRVDIISVPTVEHQKILTKGILSLVRQSGCTLEVSLVPLIEADHFKRTKLLRALYRLFLMAKPLSHKYVLGMNTGDTWLYRGPVEYLAILHTFFQIAEVFAKGIIRENAQELVVRYIKRDQDLFIEPGVEIVAEKKALPLKSSSTLTKGEDSP